MINLGYDAPSAIEFDERVEICVVCTNSVLLHVNTHHRSRWRNSEHIDTRLDVRRGPIFLYKVVEVLDRSSEQLTIVGEAVHYGVLMESLGDAGDAANAQTLYIFGNSSNDVFKVLGRYSLDIL